MRVQRQVDVVLQNHTQELLAIEDGLNVQGSWAPPGPPKAGAIVAKQGSGKWTSISTEEGIAAEGFIRFSCTKGYIQIQWRLPREADQFQYSVHTPEEDIAHTVRVTGTNLDFRVLLVTLLPVNKSAKK